MNILRFFLFLFVILIILSIQSGNVEARRHIRLSLVPIFPLGAKEIGDWKLPQGVVSLSDKIRISSGQNTGRVGNILQNDLKVRKRPILEASIEFYVHGNDKTGGDGMAFWITSEKLAPGSSFGGPENWLGLSVMFNTKGVKSNGVSDIEFHSNDGTKNIDWKSETRFQDEVNSTFVSSCNYDFRTFDSAKLMIAYIFIEDTRFNLLMSNDNGVTWNECIIDKPIYLPPTYYFSFSASDRSDTHEIHSVSISTMEYFDAEEESFIRPPIQTLANYVKLNRDNLINQLILDDNDIFEEISDLKFWFHSQIDSLRMTVGSQILELNVGLDELVSATDKMKDQLPQLTERNQQLVQSVDSLLATTNTVVRSESLKKNEQEEILSSLYSRSVIIEDYSTSISTVIKGIQYHLSRRNKLSHHSRLSYERWFSDIATYVTIGVIVIGVLLALFFLISLFRHRNRAHIKRSPSSPNWAEF